VGWFLWTYDASDRASRSLALARFNDSAWPTAGAFAFAVRRCPTRCAHPWRRIQPVTTTPASFRNAARDGRCLPARATLVDDGRCSGSTPENVLCVGVTNSSYLRQRASRTSTRAMEGPFILTQPGLAPDQRLGVEVHQADPADVDVVFASALDALIAPSQMPPSVSWNHAEADIGFSLERCGLTSNAQPTYPALAAPAGCDESHKHQCHRRFNDVLPLAP